LSVFSSLLAQNIPLSQEQIQALVRQAADKDLENQKKLRNYTYTQREEEHKLDGDGQTKSTEVRTYEIMVLFEEQVQKLVAKDDKPLSENDAKKEDGKIQKIIDKRKNEDEDDQRKRLEKAEKEQEEGRQFVKEVADAYKFRWVGTELLNGRDTYVIDADPRRAMSRIVRTQSFCPSFGFALGWIRLSRNG